MKVIAISFTFIYLNLLFKKRAKVRQIANAYSRLLKITHVVGGDAGNGRKHFLMDRQKTGTYFLYFAVSIFLYTPFHKIMNLIAFLLAAFFAYISTVLAYYGAKYALDCIRMFRSDLHTEGTVTEIRTHQRRRKGKMVTSYTAVISFVTAWKEYREVESDRNGFAVGSKMPIWYDAQDPTVFTLGGWHLAKEIAAFIFIVLCLGIAGWGALWQMVQPFMHF
jgi:Protein of unknown function (DUF3592)